MKYFTHMTNLRFEPESRKMIKQYGIAGYGFYCALLESAAESVTAKRPEPCLSEGIEDLAEYFDMKPELAAEMISYALDKNIIQKDDHIVCLKVHELLDEYLSKSSKMRESLKEYGPTEEGIREAIREEG